MTDNVVNMPMGREFIEMDDGKWWLTEKVLDDPGLRRRLVATQAQELAAVLWMYPMEELSAVAQLVCRLQQAYSDAKPFNHPTLRERWEDS
jgi:hypothetical protein